METLNQALLMVLSAALTIFVGYATLWMDKKVGKENMEKIYSELQNKDSIARRAIHLAEDTIKGPGRGEERLEVAVEWACEKLKDKGINTTSDEIRGFIRAMYDTIKDELTRNIQKKEA